MKKIATTALVALMAASVPTSAAEFDPDEIRPWYIATYLERDRVGPIARFAAGDNCMAAAKAIIARAPFLRVSCNYVPPKTQKSSTSAGR